ncbi:MAG: methyltransferase [Deltaproteobacteria bacterium]|jgi:predicted methyltransferase|nr:methyltransferase [Deltaproteobacteria bacterium]
MTHLSRLLLVPLLLLALPASPAFALSKADAEKIVAAPDRSAEDREKDERRKPALLLVFSGVEPGMKVADLGAGSGYTTELLARAVGPEGSVIGQNTPRVIEKYVKESWPARLAKPALANVVRADRSFEDPLPEGTSGLQVVTMVFVYHDTLIGDTDRAAMNRRIFDAMAPGGALIVVDHHAKSDAGPEVAETLHRIPEALLRSEIEAAGFQFEAEAGFMRNPEDPRTALFYEMDTPSDAFVHRYRKPR